MPAANTRKENHKPGSGLAEGSQMNVYEIDDGAIYVAATGTQAAVKIYWEALVNAGCRLEDDDGFEIHEVTENRARHILINVDGLGQQDAWTLAQKEGPGVLGCSEWP